MKLIRYIVEAVFWIQIALTPIFVCALATFVYLSSKKTVNIHGLWIYIIPMFAIGLAAGIYFAERTRKSVGCANFMGRLLGVSEIRNQKK